MTLPQFKQDDVKKNLRAWSDDELFGTQVNREAHLGYIAAKEIERLEAEIARMRAALAQELIDLIDARIEAATGARP